MPASLTLGLTVVGLLSAIGVGAAVLPDSITGPGAAGETPAAYNTRAPGVGGAADTAPTDPATPATGAAQTPAPKPSASAAPAKRPATAPVAAPAVGKDAVSQENEVIRLTNVERVRNGCANVTLNAKLRTAMRAHTRDMAANDYFSHDSLDGTSPWDRAKSAGYAAPIGENIAQGQRTPSAVMKSWLASPGHRANILNCDAKAVGVAVTYDGSLPIWGQLFGSV
jgi:uncharacterized protein YkwD